MFRSVSESDWKVFRELRQVALQRFCDRILAEARVELDRAGLTAHERYLKLYELIQRRDDEIARGFNDFRRSTALLQIGIMHSMRLFTPDEFRRFSPETIRSAELLAGE